MTDFLYALFIEYGTQTISWLLAAVLGPLLARLLAGYVKNQRIVGVLNRLGGLVHDVVAEVTQTFVEELKRGRADGKLTIVERKEAKRRALMALKQYLGSRGIAELLRVIGLPEPALDAWLSTRIESELVRAKLVQGLRNGGRKLPLPLPPP
jgi:hypothetical protein